MSLSRFNKRNRRQFLEDSMIAAASAATFGAAHTYLAADEPQSSSPSERLNVAVVGVKGRGGSHISAFAGRKDTVITHVCDVDREIGSSRVKEIAKRQGVEPKFSEDLRKVLEDKALDIVSIATPNHWHALGAIWAIQAGKDVYLEKPVSHNVFEGRKIVEAARKYNKICQTGTQSRSSPGLHEAIAFMKSGGVGEINFARGLCYKSRGSIGARGEFAPPSTVNYDLWLGPAPMKPVTRKQFHYDWHWQWDYGNGDLGNQGIHQMDIARWGLGLDSLCYGVLSYGGRWGYEDAGETANTQVCVFDYGPKTMVFEVRGLNTNSLKGAKVGVIFEGADGYVVMPSYENAVVYDKSGKEIKKFAGGADHFANFLKAVRSRKTSDLNADILEGHLSSALCHLGNISYRLGSEIPALKAEEALSQLTAIKNGAKNIVALRPATGSGATGVSAAAPGEAQETLERTLAHLKDNKVDLESAKLRMGEVLTFDPENETFPGNAKASELLTREYRKPFVVPEQV